MASSFARSDLMHGRFSTHALGQLHGGIGVRNHSHGFHFCHGRAFGIRSPDLIDAAQCMRTTSVMVVDREKVDGTGEGCLGG